MKESTIIDIFNGFKGHRDSIKLERDSSEYLNTVRRIDNELKEKLNSELFNLHSEFVRVLEDHWSECIEFHYAEGFKLGLKIGIECMED